MCVTPFIGMTKLGFGTREMAFDRPPADVEDTGNLVIREVLKIPQHEEFPVVDAEPTERVPDPASADLLTDEVLREAGRIAVHQCSNRVLVGADQRLATLPGASDLQALLQRDPIEPGLEGGAPTEASQACTGRQKDLLRHLPSQLLIEQMTPTVTDDGILIVLDQDAHGQRALPLCQVIPNDALAPIERLVRGPRSVHVPLRRSARLTGA